MKKGNIIKKIAGVMLGAVIVLTLAVPAFATGVTIRAIENAFTPPTTTYTAVWDNTGATYLPTGYLVQIINAGANGVADTPNTANPNYIGGDDTFITSVTVGTGTGGKAGSFSTTQGSIGGVTIYVRAWEGATFGAATRYGNSAVRAVPGAGSPPFNWDVPDFSTNLTIPGPSAGALQLNAATYSVAETGGTVTITVTRTGGSAGAVGISYATSNGSATAGSDYTTTSGTLSWAAGDTASKTFTVPITDDTAYEGNENFTVTLSAPSGGATLGSPSTATVTITDNEVPPVAGALQFNAATYTVAEGGGTATITVTRTGGSAGAVGVNYASSNGTATAGNDYTAASGTLSWAAGDTASKTFTVAITNDTADEVDETVTLTLSAPTGGATLGSPNPATLTITDDDAGGPATSVVIDDYEGTCVNPATGYYNTGMAGPGTPVPTMTRVTGAANLHEGTYGMNTVYAAGAASPNDWRGWGGTLTAAQNLSATNTLSFWMKGDGSANKVKVQFKDADGSNYGISDADAVPLTDTAWKEYRIPLNRVTTQITAGTTAGLDTARITEYQFVFTGTAASTGVLIDYVVATTEIVSTDPQIISISPTSGPSGTVVTITGSNLDVAGTVQFVTEGGVVTAVSSTATNTPITAWSANTISMRIPSMSNGSKNVKVVRASDLRESNTVTFEVTGAAASDSLTNAYPNPFNPLGGEVTRIVFSPGTATRADIMIFDMTAKLVSKLNWPTTGTIRPDGRVEVTWDGKNSYGEIVGDGVYLYRVVDGGVRKGKILVVNKK